MSELRSLPLIEVSREEIADCFANEDVEDLTFKDFKITDKEFREVMEIARDNIAVNLFDDLEVYQGFWDAYGKALKDSAREVLGKRYKEWLDNKNS